MQPSAGRNGFAKTDRRVLAKWMADITGTAETAQHKSVMQQVKAKRAKTHPDLTSEFYLMALDDRAQRLV